MSTQYLAAQVKQKAIQEKAALDAEAKRISELSPEQLFQEERDEICKIANAPPRTQYDTAMRYLNKFKLFSEGAAALGTGLTLGGPTAVVGVPMVATGVSAAVLASAAKYLIRLYATATSEFKRQIRPVLTLLCEFPAEKMKPALEIVAALQTKLQQEPNSDEQLSLIETSKLKLIVALVEATLEHKALAKKLTLPPAVEMGGATRTRARRSGRRRGYGASRASGTRRGRVVAVPRRRTETARLWRRG